MRLMAVQQKERLIRDIKKLNNELDDTRALSSMYEVFHLILQMEGGIEQEGNAVHPRSPFGRPISTIFGTVHTEVIKQH